MFHRLVDPDPMSLLGLIYIMIIAGILAGIGVFLALIINENFKMGQRLREVLAERLKLIRLQRMLKKRGMDVTAYLHEAPIHEIDENLRVCEGCNKITECENALSKSENSEINLEFCPNDGALNKLKTVQKTR